MRIKPFRWSKTVQEAYRQFHYQPSKVQRRMWVNPLPKEAFSIGRLIAVIYLPYTSSGKPHEPHIHHFGDYGYRKFKNPKQMPILAASQDGAMFILRDQSEYFLNGRGIVG